MPDSVIECRLKMFTQTIPGKTTHSGTHKHTHYVLLRRIEREWRCAISSQQNHLIAGEDGVVVVVEFYPTERRYPHDPEHERCARKCASVRDNGKINIHLHAFGRTSARTTCRASRSAMHSRICIQSTHTHTHTRLSTPAPASGSEQTVSHRAFCSG